ncbi:LysR family transcriptional regulator [Streptomyces sp. NPDC092296]|uniref:LysR family transcriptional regulator n=1 Tax=Streptomyces sp. NPDC092296 TaxID=3366012 RepID=UPI003824B856
MDLGIRTLRTFCEVIHAGSFTRAARRLGYSQSSVTAQVRALEDQVGEPVFERLPTGVRLTPAGHTLHAYARQMLELVGEMEEALRGPAARTPRVVLGLPHSLAYGQQLTRLAHLGRRLLPGVQLAVRVLGTEQLRTALREAEVDGAVLLTGPARATAADVPAPPGEGDDQEGGSATVPLLTVEFSPVVGAASAARPEPARPVAGPPPVVITDPDCPSQRWLPELLRLREGRAPEIVEIGSADGVHILVLSGLGCAMLPTALTAARQGKGLLPLPEVPAMHWTASLVTSPDGGLPAVHRKALAELLRQVLGGSPRPSSDELSAPAHGGALPGPVPPPRGGPAPRSGGLSAIGVAGGAGPRGEVA